MKMPRILIAVVLWLAVLTCIPLNLQAQDAVKMVGGTVVDKASGEPLPGVSVAILQDGHVITGAVTDIEGHFQIADLPSNTFVVQVSYMGYRTQTLASTTAHIDRLVLQLAEDTDNALSEVVVTGYFNKNKNAFTGAVTQISAAELKQVSSVNIITAISALTPGLEIQVDDVQGSNPNHVPELVLRGMSSFSNSGQDVNQPTIILDGAEISMTDLYDLDINEVENITVLKDASATALYGSKAASGVIVITRKPLLEGVVHVSYNMTGDVQLPRLSDYHMLGAADKLEYERLAGLYDADGAISSTTGLPLQWELDELYNERYKRVQSGVDSDWLAQPARNSFSHSHSLRIYGGGGNMRYELTGRYGNTHGVMKDDYRKRYSLGFKLDYFINNKIQISNRTTYAELDTKDSPYGSFSDYVQMNPYDLMYNEDGTVNTQLSWDLDNPLYEATLGSYSKSGSQTFSNLTEFRWDISTKWRLTGQFNINSDSGWSEDFTSPSSLTYKYETDPTKKGRLYLSSSRGPSWSGKANGAFNQLWDDESLVSLNAGWEINHSNTRSDYCDVIGFYSDVLHTVSSAAQYNTGRPTGSQTESADVGWYVNGTGSYKNRYVVDGTWRVTGSSQFGANNRYGQFWSAGLGWNVLNEGFMEGCRDKFDLFKFRYSMGYTGKVSFSPYQAMTMYQYSNSYEYRNGIGAVPVTIGDVDLTWERTMNYNIGLDYSMFGRRLNIVVDAYIKQTKDLLLERSLAPSTGVTSAKQNLGELRNRGIEFQVDGYLVQNRDFYWKLGTTGYTNENKITKIGQALKELNERNAALSEGSVAPLPQYAEGQSLTALKLVHSAGIDPATGKEIYTKLDGTLTFTYDATDKILVGDTNPRYYGTANTNLYWRGVSLYLLGSFRLGGWVYNSTRASKVEGCDPKKNADQRVFDSRWTQAGDIAYYKDIADSSIPKQTDRFAEVENSLTLTSVNIGYDLDRDLCRRMHLTSLRLGIDMTDIMRLSTVKIERGTSYLYSKGIEFTLSTTL